MLNKHLIILFCLLLMGCVPTTTSQQQTTTILKETPVVSATTPSTSTPIPTATVIPKQTTPISVTATSYPKATSQWRCHPSGGLGCFGPLGDITMISANEGWLGEHLYYGQRSGDTEPSWHRIPQSEMPAFHSLDMVSPTEGWAITVNGGRPLHLFKTDTNIWNYEIIEKKDIGLGNLDDLDMLSPDEGWAVGGGAYHYLNGEWQSSGQKFSGGDFTSISMVSPTEGWIGVKVSDIDFYYYNGETWQPYDKEKLEHLGFEFESGGAIFDIAAIDANNVWAASNKGILYYHDDQWNFQLEGEDILNILMVSETEGWAIGWTGMFHYQDGEWYPVELPIEEERLLIFDSIDMVSETEGWATSGDILLRYQNNEWEVTNQIDCLVT